MGKLLKTTGDRREEQNELTSQREARMSALLKKRAKERAAQLERRLRGEDGSGDEGGEEVEELALYKVCVCLVQYLTCCVQYFLPVMDV